MKSRGLLGRFFFDWFNRWFNRLTDGYVKGCGVLLHKFAFSLILLVGFSLLAGWFGSKLPSGFLPDEDQGYVFAAIQLPDASSLQRTETAAEKVEKMLHATPGVEHVTTVVGYNMLSAVQNTYSAFFWVTASKRWAGPPRPVPRSSYRSDQGRASAMDLRSPPRGHRVRVSPPRALRQFRASARRAVSPLFSRTARVATCSFLRRTRKPFWPRPASVPNSPG